MTIQPFTLDVLRTARLFAVLRDLDSDDVSVWRRTPAGDELWDKANLARMANGQVLVWFDNPLSPSINLSAIAKAGDREEVVNLVAFERLLPHLPSSPDVDTNSAGVFVFCRSMPIVSPGQEWRCDNTLYGTRPYPQEGDDSPVVTQGAHSIEVYEPVLSVNGVGNLVFTKMRNDTEIRRLHVLNASTPVSGFTLGEVFKVMHEWSQTVGDPFNCTDDVASDCATWLATFGFDPTLVDNQPAMQVAKYLSGDHHARQRPSNVAPDKPELRRFVMRRTAFSTLSALCVLFDDLGDTTTILREEERQLRLGFERFRNYYRIPTDVPITDVDGIAKRVLADDPRAVGVDGWIRTQLGFLLNKREMLNRVRNDDV